MKLVFIYGPPAAGKYTIARNVAEKTGLALFHNHLIVDAVAAVFPFGSEAFVALRERFWMDVFDAACEADRSLIFTFQPESSVAPDFPSRVKQRVEDAGGRIIFARLDLSLEGQLARIANPDRARFGKLTDPDLLKRLHADFAASEAIMPPADIRIDTDAVPPEEAADRIAALLD